MFHLVADVGQEFLWKLIALFCVDFLLSFSTSVPISCGKPDDIPHAKYTGSSFKFNDKLRYMCEDGYTLKGHRRRKCGEGGKWSKAPKCLGLFNFVVFHASNFMRLSEGATQQSFIRKGSAPISKPLHLYILTIFCTKGNPFKNLSC